MNILHPRFKSASLLVFENYLDGFIESVDKMRADSKLFHHFWALKVADAVVLKTESVDGVEMELHDILNASVPALRCLVLLQT